MKAGIFFYVAAARLVLGEPILLIRPTEHTSGTSTPYYTFDVEYCIPEDRNIPIQESRYGCYIMVGIISLPFSRNVLRKSLERANQCSKK